MLRTDGSHHDWFEGRGPACVFMGCIDDAVNRVFGRFYEYEGTVPAMDSIKRCGLPMKAYLGRHTAYNTKSHSLKQHKAVSRIGMKNNCSFLPVI